MNQNVKNPDFWEEKLDILAGRKMSKVFKNGIPFIRYELFSSFLFPIKPGSLSIPSATFKVIKTSQGNNFFGNFFAETAPFFVKSESKKILAIQTPNQLPTGQYVIGEYVSSNKNIHVGSSYEFDVLIKGDGNIHMFPTPKYLSKDGLEMYEPKVDISNKLVDNKLVGSKRIHYTFIPNSKGNYKLDEIVIPFFNPVNSQTDTLRIPAKEFDVTAQNAKDINYSKLINNSNTQNPTYFTSRNFANLILSILGLSFFVFLSLLFQQYIQKRKLNS